MMEKENGDQRSQQPSFDEFPIPSVQDWLKTVEKSLKGAPFDKLMTKTYEEITIKPIYTSQDIEGSHHLKTLPGFPPYIRGNEPLGYLTHPWEVSQELSEGDLDRFASVAKTAMERGQTTLHIHLDEPSRRGENPSQANQHKVGKNGLSLFCLSDLERACSNINWETTPVFIQAGELSSPIISLFAALFKKQGTQLVHLQGCIGADPYGEWVVKGTLSISLPKSLQAMADTIRWTQKNTPTLQTICVRGGPYHNGGGNVVQELAFTLATAVEYIRELLERKLTIDEIASQMRFSFSTGSPFFMEIAKYRAARWLWARIIEAFGGSRDFQKMYIHARTSARTKTLFDPHVNILRSTTEAAVSILGGVNSLHVSSFDEVIQQDNEMAERIARNTQLILDQEAHLSKVVDPAGGSWYVESLTQSIAEKAWELFQRVEQLGGMRKALIDQFPQQEVAKVAAERKGNMDLRKDKWVGTNVYANIHEPSSQSNINKNLTSYQQQRISISTAKKSPNISLDHLKLKIKKQPQEWLNKMIDSIYEDGLTLGECYQLIRDDDQGGKAEKTKPIQPQRTTASFEALRLAAIRYQEKIGNLPTVFLANLGSLAQHKTRSDFSQAFLAAGGFQSIASKGLATVHKAVEAILDSGERIVVICSADDVYPEWVPPLARAVKAKNKDIFLLLAGKPSKEQLEIYKKAGLDDCIHVRSNQFDMLLTLLQKKGIRL